MRNGTSKMNASKPVYNSESNNELEVVSEVDKKSNEITWGQNYFTKLTKDELVVLAEDLLDWPKERIDETAHEELNNRCFESMYELLELEIRKSKILISQNNRKDWVQDFLGFKLPAALPKYNKQKDKSFKAWFGVVWKNYLTDKLRRARRERERNKFYEEKGALQKSVLEIVQPPGVEIAADIAHRNRIRQHLNDALKKLPHSEEELVRAYYFTTGKSLKDISEELNISYPTAKTRLYRARCRLYGMLKSLVLNSS